MKKRIIALLVVVLLCVAAHSMAQAYPVASEDFVWEIHPVPEGVSLKENINWVYFSDGMMLVNTDRGDGFLRTDGTLLVSNNYPWVNASAFGDEAAYVEEYGRGRVIDTEGEMVSELFLSYRGEPNPFSEVSLDSEGVLKVSMKCVRNGVEYSPIGYAHIDGELFVDPRDFEYAQGTSYSYGLARVADFNGVWHIIDYGGRKLFTLEEGVMPYATVIMGYIAVKECEYELVSSFHRNPIPLGNLVDCVVTKNLIYARQEDVRESKVYDYRGNLIADRNTLLSLGIKGTDSNPNWPYIAGIDHELIRFVGVCNGNSGVGYLDQEGNLVIEPKPHAAAHQEWFVPFAENGKIGLMDIEGGILIEPMFDNISKICDQACVVVIDEKLYTLRMSWNNWFQ